MEPVKSSYGFVDSGNVIALLFELILDAQVFQIEFSNKESVLGGIWIRGDQLIAAKILDYRGGEAIEALLTQPDLHSYIVYKLDPEDTADIDPIGSLSEMLYELVSTAHQSKSHSLTAVADPESPSEATQEAVADDDAQSSSDDDAQSSSDDDAQSSAALELAADPEPVDELVTNEVETESVSTVLVDTVSETPVLETPALEAPVLETPALEAPVLEAPVLEKPMLEIPVAKKTVELASVEPAPAQPVAAKPVAAKAVAAKPVPTKPAPVKAAPAKTETPITSSRAESPVTPPSAQRSKVTAPPQQQQAPKRAARRGRILAVVSPKGGVGKTTVSLNLAVALAQQGYSVVLVDADPQGGVTNSLMASGEAPTGVYDVLMRRESFGSVVRSTKLENLRLMPAGRLLPEEVITRSGQLSNPELWKRVLETVQRLVDIVIVDTPAGVQGVTTPILAAATHVVAVSQPEPLSLRSLPQLNQTLKALSQIGTAAELTGVILNMVQPERPVSLGVLETLSKKVVNGDTLLEPMLVRSELLLRASSSAMPLMFASDPAYQPLKRVFEDLATELLQRMNLQRTVTQEESFLVA